MSIVSSVLVRSLWTPLIPNLSKTDFLNVSIIKHSVLGIVFETGHNLSCFNLSGLQLSSGEGLSHSIIQSHETLYHCY